MPGRSRREQLAQGRPAVLGGKALVRKAAVLTRDEAEDFT
jgi:hypothetical protein